MFKRLLLSGVGLAAVGALPVACYTVPGCWEAVRGHWFPSDDSAAADAALQPGGSAAGTLEMPPEGPPVGDLAEVLRFDVTADWIQHRWPRVSTGLAHPQLQGYRVPLVSGTAESDVAGSLTYYFNAQNRLQRLTFQGTTGDPRKLVTMLKGHYKFMHRPTTEPGLYRYESVSSEGNPGGVLTIRSAGVVRSSDPYRRYQLDLVMERPS